MQARKLALACGVAFAAIAGHASAATVTFSPEITLNVSGASALRLSFGQAIVDICNAAQPRVWIQNDGRGTSRRAYYCTLRTDLGLDAAIAGKRVLIHKRDSGGSSRGVQPVALGSSLSRAAVPNTGAAFSDVIGTVVPDADVEGSGLTCTVTNPGTATDNVFDDMPAGWVALACAGQINDVPKFGLSDVSVEAFVGENKDTPLEPDWSPALAAAVTVDSFVGAQVFGVGVNDAFYTFLQQQQGLNTADKTAGPNQPSLSKAVITSLLSGGTRSWSSVFDMTAAPAGTSDGPKVCRRTNGSGTQATSNRFFLEYPCIQNLPATNLTDDDPGNDAAPGSTAANGGAYQVVMNSGSGDVPVCFEAAETQKEFALGVLSLENRVQPANKFRYIKIDGQSPNEDVNGNSVTAGDLAENTTDNFANGLYQFGEEFVAIKSNSIAGTSAEKVWDQIVNGLKNPANLFRTDAADTVFLPGLLGHALSGFVPTPLGTDKPVYRFTKLGNFCGTPIQVFPQDLTPGNGGDL